MSDLRSALESAGLARVSTYIQSGNILFDSGTSGDSLESATALEGLIHETIAKGWSLDIPVIVRTSQEFGRLASQNPFHEGNPRHVHLMLLKTAPVMESLQPIPDVSSPGEEFEIQGRTVYLHCPHGSAKSRLTNTFFEKFLRTAATTRNWNTVNQVLQLLE